MSKLLQLVIFICLIIFLSTSDVLASENNRVGVHIFDPNEIDKVADLVNSNGGDWGYVTVPLRADDRDREKWQNFMHKCSQYHVIPIIRLATTIAGDYWTKPTQYDYIDFANFLNDLKWPVKQRYVIVYNEPNHAQEWGNEVNPNQYAHELNKTISLFKERNNDFFMLPAGLDMAAPNNESHMQWRKYILQMWAATTDSLTNLDGWNSHSYPNPAFSGNPFDKHDHSILSYQFEMQLYKNLTGRDIPVFITETGWNNEFVSDDNIASYYKLAFTQVWKNDQIRAITPFVLQAGAGPFVGFSLLDGAGNPKPQYQTLKWLSKVKGDPELNNFSNNPISPVLGLSNQASPSAYPKLINSSQSELYDTLELIKKWLNLKK